MRLLVVDDEARIRELVAKYARWPSAGASHST